MCANRDPPPYVRISLPNASPDVRGRQKACELQIARPKERPKSVKRLRGHILRNKHDETHPYILSEIKNNSYFIFRNTHTRTKIKLCVGIAFVALLSIFTRECEEFMLTVIYYTVTWHIWRDTLSLFIYSSYFRALIIKPCL